MNLKMRGCVLISLGAVAVAAAAFVTYEAIHEAFGSGPPYYSRSTNMDKWSNPLPIIVVVDTLALAAAGLLVRHGIRQIRRRERSSPVASNPSSGGRSV